MNLTIKTNFSNMFHIDFQYILLYESLHFIFQTIVFM